MEGPGGPTIVAVDGLGGLIMGGNHLSCDKPMPEAGKYCAIDFFHGFSKSTPGENDSPSRTHT